MSDESLLSVGAAGRGDGTGDWPDRDCDVDHVNGGGSGDWPGGSGGAGGVGVTDGVGEADGVGHAGGVGGLGVVDVTASRVMIQGIEFFLGHGTGTCRGGLLFRVGMADENFGNHGITHLIEHLAFDGMLDPAEQLVHANGRTGDVTTGFVVEGSVDEVVRFINRIVANLRDLPLHRLEKEKHILQIEQTRRGGAVGEARNTRHGLQDFGLSGVSEIGLNRVGEAEVTAWAKRYFTSGNVVGFFTGDDSSLEVFSGVPVDVPTGVRADVPTGVRADVPTGIATGVQATAPVDDPSVARMDGPSVVSEVEPTGIPSDDPSAASVDVPTGIAVGLDLSLPPGFRQPLPTPSLSSAADPLPKAYRYRSNAVVVEALVPTGAALGTLCQLAQTRLTYQLREVDAVSYSVTVDAEPVSGALSRLTCVADTQPDNGSAVAGALVDQLAALSRGHISDEELGQARHSILTDLDSDDYAAAVASARAINRLLGRADETTDQKRTRYEAVTRADVAEVARLVRDGAFWVTPDANLEWAGIPHAVFTAPAVEGYEFAAINDEEVLIVAERGVSVVRDDTSRTVLYEDCVGVEAYPDGMRVIAGRTGVMIWVEPTLFRGLTPALVAALIDPHIHPDRLIPMPARHPNDIPQPPEPSVAPVPLTQSPTPPEPPRPSWNGASPSAPPHGWDQAVPPQPHGWVQAAPVPPPGWDQAAPPQPGYPPAWQSQQQSWVSQPPPIRRPTAVVWRVLSIIVAIVFALAAGFVALMLSFAVNDPDPGVRDVVPVFWVMLVICLGLTALFIWLALRNRR